MKKEKDTILKGLVDKLKQSKEKTSTPVNLEAMVNSGRVRLKKNKLRKVEDKSQQRKKRND